MLSPSSATHHPCPSVSFTVVALPPSAASLGPVTSSGAVVGAASAAAPPSLPVIAGSQGACGVARAVPCHKRYVVGLHAACRRLRFQAMCHRCCCCRTCCAFLGSLLADMSNTTRTSPLGNMCRPHTGAVLGLAARQRRR